MSGNSTQLRSESSSPSESRLTFCPDERFLELRPVLDQHLAEAGETLAAENFASLLDSTMRRVIDLAFRDAHADEGTVWIADKTADSLVAAYNTGPNAETLVGRFRQPLNAGLISMVYANERPFLENKVAQNTKQDKSLDLLLKVHTSAMLAAPFYFMRACRGVVSCVQLAPAGSVAADAGFIEGDLGIVRHAAGILGSLIDFHILKALIGLS